VTVIGLKQAIPQVGGEIAHQLQFVGRWNLMSAPL
jgi:hypothetical protein